MQIHTDRDCMILSQSGLSPGWEKIFNTLQWCFYIIVLGVKPLTEHGAKKKEKYILVQPFLGQDLLGRLNFFKYEKLSLSKSTENCPEWILSTYLFFLLHIFGHIALTMGIKLTNRSSYLVYVIGPKMWRKKYVCLKSISNYFQII